MQQGHKLFGLLTVKIKQINDYTFPGVMKINQLFGLALLLSGLYVTAGCSQTRTMTEKKNSLNTGQRTAPDTSVQDARYMRTSVSDGTATNNSNTTNYNSNNAVNNPTGAGRNPNTHTAPGNPSNNDRGASDRTDGIENNTNSTSGANAGTAAAIEKAPTNSKTPAVDVGSTDRNTSIGDFIASSPNHTTLQNALQATGLDETLKAGGSYTLFAPSNAAFKKVPANLAGKLLDGSNHDALKQLLLNHVVDGAINVGQLKEKIKASNGKAMLRTMAGGTLTATLGNGGSLVLTDAQGQTARVAGSDVAQTNGFVHDVSSVLMSQAGASAFR